MVPPDAPPSMTKCSTYMGWFVDASFVPVDTDEFPLRAWCDKVASVESVDPIPNPVRNRFVSNVAVPVVDHSDVMSPAVAPDTLMYSEHAHFSLAPNEMAANVPSAVFVVVDVRVSSDAFRRYFGTNAFSIPAVMRSPALTVMAIP